MSVATTPSSLVLCPALLCSALTLLPGADSAVRTHEVAGGGGGCVYEAVQGEGRGRGRGKKRHTHTDTHREREVWSGVGVGGGARTPCCAVPCRAVQGTPEQEVARGPV